MATSAASTTESRLYQNAVSALSARQAAWEATRTRLLQVDPGGQGDPNLAGSGPAVVRIIETENQLSDDPPNADPALLAAALTKLSAVSWPADVEGVQEAYEKALAPHALRGQPIASKPPVVFRYITGTDFWERIAKALRDVHEDILASELDDLMARAGRQPAEASWDEVAEFVTDPAVWGILNRKAVPLGGGKGMFVTFDAGQAVHRDSSRWLHAALALRCPWKPRFAEIRYTLRKADELRFPTLADAGWFRWFRSAAVGEPYGWTRPHPPLDPEADRQPEAVHKTPSLARVRSSADVRIVPP